MLVPQYQNEDFGLRPELCFQRKQRYRSVAKRKIEILDFIGFLEKRYIFLSKYIFAHFFIYLLIKISVGDVPE